ncbi:MAG: NTP transferase domain-containing protein [Armatimonadia bacterium]|nr:NTP transferase domain-containing protein [Armatimonadia bacterium]
MDISRAVVTAAGLGERLYPLTKAQPREMLPLGRKPAVQFIVEELIAAGVTEICIVVSPGSRAIENHFSIGPNARCNGSFPNELLDDRAHLYFVEQPEPRGTGDAILRARGFVGEEAFVVALGDAVITPSDAPNPLIRRMIHTFAATGGDAVVAVRDVDRAAVSQYGVVTPVGDGLQTPHFMISDIIEKPAIDAAPSTIAVAGRYVFSSLVFNYLAESADEAGGDVHLTEALQRMVHDRESTWAERVRPGENRFDLGNFLEYSRAFIRFSMDDPEVGLSIREYLRGLTHA